MATKKIILDTNFLLIPAQFRVDIFSEIRRICDFTYKILILDKSIQELENIITKGKGKEKQEAKVTLELIKQKNIEILKTERSIYVDDYIVELAKKSNYIIATQDRALIQRLKLYKIKVISLRQKKYLIFK